MKFRIIFFSSLVLASILFLLVSTNAEQEPVTVETETDPTLVQGTSSEDYLRNTVEEAQYLLNSEDPRVWRRAMMSE